MSIDLAKKYLASRAISSQTTGGLSLIKKCYGGVLPIAEVMAILELAQKRKLKAFIKHTNKYTTTAHEFKL